METKRCTHCDEEKPVGPEGAYYWAKNGKLKAGGSYTSHCKDCDNAKRKLRYLKNRPDALSYKRRHRVENREDYLRRYRNNYDANRDRILTERRDHYSKNRASILARKRGYNKRNPQISGTARAVERSHLSEYELFEGITRSKVNEEVAFTYRLCRLVSERTGVEHHVDHIIPIARGGVHRLWNLRILPAEKNYSKRAQSDEEWFNLTETDIERLDAEALEFTP